MNSTVQRCFLLVILAFLLFPTILISQDLKKQALTDTLFIKQIVLCTGVRNREPVNIVEMYTSNDKRAYCYVRVYNSRKSTIITFRWFYKNEHYHSMKAKVGISKSWRTYSSVRTKPGLWRVEVLDENGKLLEGIGFRVHEEETPKETDIFDY